MMREKHKIIWKLILFLTTYKKIVRSKFFFCSSIWWNEEKLGLFWLPRRVHVNLFKWLLSKTVDYQLVASSRIFCDKKISYHFFWCFCSNFQVLNEGQQKKGMRVLYEAYESQHFRLNWLPQAVLKQIGQLVDLQVVFTSLY